MSAITLTFGDCAENHVGMQSIGEMDLNGYSLDDIMTFVNNNNFHPSQIELTPLHEMETTQQNQQLPEAWLLVIREGIKVCVNDTDLWNEMINLDWDTKAKMKGKVVNKHARYNLCFDENSQESCFEEGKGTIVKFMDVPVLNTLLNYFKLTMPKSENLKVEGNYYYDVEHCGIGYHGDSERKKVIGVRLGSTMPLRFQWYQNGERTSDQREFMLNHGDIYIMSEKTVGTDWKKRKIPTLRHAAGCLKYIK
eukprot:gene14389-19312_t